MRTAAALIIGNEILTGKVEEANVAFLGKELFGLGIALRRIVVCPDEHEVIAADVNALRSSHDFVFTSGGVGPTHDDITIESIAAAFGRRVIRSAEVETLILRYHEKRDRPVTDEHLRMADIIEGARLVRSAEVAWPTLVVENVYIMPGVPEVFRLKFAALRASLDEGTRFHSEAVFTRCDEGEIAGLLQMLTTRHPQVLIGSYISWKNPEYRTKLTFDAEDAARARAAADDLVSALAAESLVRRDPA